MKSVVLKTDMHCQKCIDKVEPLIESSSDIVHYAFDLNSENKTLTLHGHDMDINALIIDIGNLGYTAEILTLDGQLNYETPILKKQGFWKNKRNWSRASFNTLNCLIGCSIGDFGMLIYLQAYHPDTPMYIQMILAIIAGLTTSIILETIILKTREKFNWTLAFQTAISMSFISMVGMELAMNTTDFMITGGKAAFNTATYWLAFIPALIAGFLFPLPYNYYKLEKFGRACH